MKVLVTGGAGFIGSHLVDAYLGRKFKGVVTEIANSANTTGVTAEQVTNFVVKIRILQESYMDLLTANNNIAPFRPGMSATVDVQTKKVNNVIAVPIQSVTTRNDSTEFNLQNKGKEKGGDGDVVVTNDNEKKQNNDDLIKIQECVFVYNAAEGKVKMVPVKTGIQDNNYIEILSGIKEGDEIVSAPYSAIAKELKDGDVVNKVDKAELFSVTKK